MSMTHETRSLRPRTEGAEVTRSVCPYCAVGCGQLIFHRDGRVISIEGDPESPISEGQLCPKGAASFELLTHGARATKRQVPRAGRVGVAGDRARNGHGHGGRSRVELARAALPDDARRRAADAVSAIAHLGGATLDNEENYLIKKLFTAGLGMVAVSNQARI